MRLAIAALVVLFDASAAHADGWEVRIRDELDRVSLTVAPGGGRTISRDGPVRISLSSDTLTLERHRLGRRDAADPDADALRFEIGFAPPTAGDHELTVDVRAWLCGAKTCRPVRETRTVKVRAARPTPAEPSSP